MTLARPRPGAPSSPTPEAALPKGVLATIARQDEASERLIRLIQLGIVLFFGLLYAAAPRPPNMTAFSPVPYALGLYLALTLIGLRWTFRGPLPDWAVYGSIGIDIALLMGLIWSFHLQYGQPPAFYLKAPTFLYAFIFIALRALRFQPRFVLAAGIVATLGWLALVGYVALTQPMEGAITRDYVHYLTSNSVLVGAEIDKAVALLVVTAILWLALRRARGLLVLSVAEGSAAANLSRFFDPSVASRIRASDRASLARGARREAAVLFIDLRGFTRIAAMLEPDETVSLLAAYQQRVVPLVQQHGGAIDKFLGDGIMATFGAVESSPTFAADALRAVDAVMADSDLWAAAEGPLSRLPPRSIGAAVAAGPVVFGTVGDEHRLEFTVIGPPVNLAAKLEKQTKALGCRALTTAEAYQIALAQDHRPAGEPALVRSEVEGTGKIYDLVVLQP